MFETQEIRTSFINAIAAWIESSYNIHGEQLEDIRSSLAALPDDELIKAGTEVETFEKESKTTLQRMERQVLSVEHSIEETIERSNVSLPVFS